MKKKILIPIVAVIIIMLGIFSIKVSNKDKILASKDKPKLEESKSTVKEITSNKDTTKNATEDKTTNEHNQVNKTNTSEKN